MSNAYTTDSLVSSVKNRMMLPDASSGSFSPAVILALATEELQGPIVTMVMAAREKYYETYADQAIVASQATYAIPSRAIGGVVSVVQLVVNSSLIELTPLDPNQCTSTTPGNPRGFYFQNNSIVLYPTPAQAGASVRMRYFQRPSTLEQTINCAQVASIDPIALTITVGAAPSTWTTGTVVDFIPQAIPYTPYSLNTALTGVATNVLSVAAIPTGLVVGDWVALAETTPIPEILRELFPVLAQATACKVLEAGGDMEKLQFAQQKLQGYIQAAQKQLTPRDQSTPKKVVSNWRAF